MRELKTSTEFVTSARFSINNRYLTGVLVLAVGQLVVWSLLFYVFPAMLVHWENSTEWSKSQLTGAITCALLISAAASPLAGRIIDRGYGRGLLCGSTALGSLVMLLLSQVTTLTEFYIYWCIMGLAFAGCLYDPCFSIITRHSRASAKKPILWVTLIAGFASSISFPVVHKLIQYHDWRSLFMGCSVLALLLGVPLMYTGSTFLMSEKTSEHAPSKSANRLPVASPGFWLLGIALASIGFIHGVLMHHLLPMLQEREVALSLAVTIAALIGPMQVAGRLFIVSTDKLLTNHQLLLLCFISMSAASTLLAIAGQSTTLLVFFVAVFGSAYGMISVLRPVIARELLGANTFATRSGLLATVYLCFAALAPYLGARIWQLGGYHLVMLIVIASGLLGTLLYWSVHKHAN